MSHDWGAEGIHWTGTPGDEIQRLDDMSDYGGGEPPFPGDMHAALHVARNGFPFVLYERFDIELGAWQVTAFRYESEAVSFSRYGSLPDLVYAFAIDGRKHEEADLPPAPDGNGYCAPENALYVYPDPQ